MAKVFYAHGDRALLYLIELMCVYFLLDIIIMELELKNRQHIITQFILGKALLGKLYQKHTSHLKLALFKSQPLFDAIFRFNNRMRNQDLLTD